jgi:hypothetical protein
MAEGGGEPHHQEGGGGGKEEEEETRAESPCPWAFFTQTAHSDPRSRPTTTRTVAESPRLQPAAEDHRDRPVHAARRQRQAGSRTPSLATGPAQAVSATRAGPGGPRGHHNAILGSGVGQRAIQNTAVLLQHAVRMTRDEVFHTRKRTTQLRYRCVLTGVERKDKQTWSPTKILAETRRLDLA